MVVANDVGKYDGTNPLESSTHIFKKKIQIKLFNKLKVLDLGFGDRIRVLSLGFMTMIGSRILKSSKLLWKRM